MGTLPKIGADTSLAHRAYLVLREAILAGQFRPGQVLSEENLAAELAISRTPVRAALKRLAFEHLIVLNPSKNIVVPEISRAELQDIQAARLALEPAAARQLAGRATAEQIRKLWEEIARQRLAAESETAADILCSEYAFHTMAARFAGNHWIAEMVSTLNLANRRYLGLPRQQARHTASHWEEAIREHEAVMTAIERRDAEAAENRMRDHISRTCARLFH